MSIPRRNIVRSLLATVIALGIGLTALPARAADTGVKVVYHLSDGIPQAARAIGNIRNHLAADPSAKIVVVTHGAGIDFLLDGAESAPGQALCRQHRRTGRPGRGIPGLQ